MSIESAAAIGTSHAQQQVATQVSMKAVQIANQHQKSALSLLEAAVETIEQAMPTADNPGSRIDIRA